MAMRHLLRLRLRKIRWAVIGVLAACGGGDGTGPTPASPGTVDIRLIPPPGRSDGIVMLRIAGGTVKSVRAGTGMEIYTTGEGSDSAQVIVRGILQGPRTILTVCVPDVKATAVDKYELDSDLIQAAADSLGAYAIRTDLGAYSVQFVNPKASTC